eukprot:CAMPEP_0175831354 /NCGR_PEP_ID=MMETSP0107_2-20121207/14413_1 /TAXON_ID=195067 ORGANISM="Goniomonas pacifica, Strain CCMP1869" /NCGR_SAMPLE_ID=MMETSP0107_2 /ASSEMBLY_ACC=CAM_ASM_000203 /LENGTH=40 /DNA_ID= /DNA_START= /DNA_END= /DNA_ORIENTATION=
MLGFSTGSREYAELQPDKECESSTPSSTGLELMLSGSRNS